MSAEDNEAALRANQERRAASIRLPDKNPNPDHGEIVNISDDLCMEYQAVKRIWRIYRMKDGRWQPIGEHRGDRESAVEVAKEL